MSTANKRLRFLVECPPGAIGCRAFEDRCLAILEYLFVPPLKKPRIQSRSLSGIDRRDAVFSNREFGAANPWGYLLSELEARMILFEFKNYDVSEIGKDEVDQVHNYLTIPMGRLAILCCNKLPCKAAYVRRNSIYNSERKVILFLTPDNFREMCFIKERGEDPGNLILDLVEEFYIQLE